MSREDGLVSLFMAVMLLLGSSLALFAVLSRAQAEALALTETLQTRQAFLAAQAGLDHALTHARHNGINQQEIRLSDRLAPGTLPGQARYRSWYCDPGLPAGGCPVSADSGMAPCLNAHPDAPQPLIVACGWSPTGDIRQFMQLSLTRLPALARLPEAPLIVGGDVYLEGHSTLYNHHRPFNVWSGGAFFQHGGPHTRFVRAPQTPRPAQASAPPPPPATCRATQAYVCTQDARGAPDRISHDPALAALGASALFAHYLGAEPAVYRQHFAAFAHPADTLAQLEGFQGVAIWLDGNARLEGSLMLGTPEQPVTLAIDGNLEGQGNLILHGFLFVRGNLALEGQHALHGAVLVGGDARFAGRVELAYHPEFFERSARTGRLVAAAAGWRDGLASSPP